MPDTASPAHDLPDDAAQLAALAVDVLRRAKAGKLLLATAESCTGGLIASLLTDQQGYGQCFDRGFVVYTEKAKSDLLGIEPVELRRHGVVSEEIAAQMARHAIVRSDADIALSITGFAGPGNPGDEAGLVHLACADRAGRLITRECRFGDVGRERTRLLAAHRALEMIGQAIATCEAGQAPAPSGAAPEG